MATRIIVIGYGNPDRQDDGVAWHILTRLAAHYNIPIPDSPYEGLDVSGQAVDLYFDLQLVPELAERVSAYSAVVFVDAHTGRVPEEIHLEELVPNYQASPLTHHLTPSSLLDLAKTAYDAAPQALLVSVRGYEFKFVTTLSDCTAALVDPAVERIVDWITQQSSPEELL